MLLSLIYDTCYRYGLEKVLLGAELLAIGESLTIIVELRTRMERELP